jgi:hypothetical protein
MMHDILSDATLYVIIILGFLSLARFLLMDVGSFWRFLKNWWTFL